MIPLRLQLSNFLSYGESPPVLDLEGIHVACLSGGNGQGKSALLDAMTWAIWGEARKSGESRKPDDELLRSGTRAMKVDFSFRVGGVDLRVVRSYQRSASGKTSKPGLEFQVRDEDDWRPLTAESLRATQAVINERVGVDYETFINSTFLLQGRSDEFTKKRPGERKEILGKILALGRYEAMASRAGQRWSRLREQANALEAERARLDEVLEPVARWTAERIEVEREVADAQSALDKATDAATEAASRLAAFDSLVREAESRSASLASLAKRVAALDEEGDTVAARIERAEAVVASAATIEAEHAQYEALREQRTALDEKATLFRGIEAQRHALQLDMQQRTAAARAELVALEAALVALDQQIEADSGLVAERSDVEAAHARARAATDSLLALDALAQDRATIERRIEVLDKRLAADKGALEGTLAQIILQGKHLSEQAASASEADLDALRADRDAGVTAKARRNDLQKEGGEAARAVGALESTLASLDAKRAGIERKRQRLLTTEDETCPTCGTALTEAHREEVLSGYQADLAALQSAYDDAQTQHHAAIQRRDALRVEFIELGTSIERGEHAARALAAIGEELARAT
ncbi:MAG: SMC family ATPase, partial [Bacteroidota bacterium]